MLRGWRQCSLQAALVAVLLRALVPAGFMAAPVSAGWPWQLCPSGMATSSYRALLGVGAGVQIDGHEAHLGHGEESAATDDSGYTTEDSEPACSLGAGFSALEQFDGLEPPDLRLAQQLVARDRYTLLPRAPPRRYHSRAPPAPPVGV